MLAGAHFGPNANLTLPSGERLSAAEANALTGVYADAAGPQHDLRCQPKEETMIAPRITDQPTPVPNDGPSIQALVRADLLEREQVGVARYGTPLQAFNGRDALVDAYQEALDLACYLRQALEER